MKSLLAAVLSLISSGGISDLPNPSLTPGAIADTDVNIVCSRGYSKLHRPPEDVSHNLKLQAMDRYHIPHSRISEFELDALVPICLGGDHYNQKNLWLQPWASAHYKDREMEIPACKRVCTSRDQRLLIQYQKQFMLDWRQVQ